MSATLWLQFSENSHLDFVTIEVQ